jgi:5-methyltetrahydrofolate--homocysteine methyltransferase
MNQPYITPALESLLRDRIAVLDGAMGSLIQREGLGEADFRNAALANHPIDLKGNNDLLALTRPDVIQKLHEQYFAAGSDIIETNTFSSNVIAQADYALEHLAYELNKRSAEVARTAAEIWTKKTPDKPRFVAGAMGPTNRLLSMSPKVDDPSFRAVTFDQVKDAYVTQIEGLLDGGVDLLLFETITDTLITKAGIFAMEEVFAKRKLRVPVMISATITDRSGRTLSGQTIEAFWTSVSHARPLTVGINCALGAADMRPFLADLARAATTRASPATRTRACRTRSAPTTSSPRPPGASSASSPRAASSTSWAAAAARRPRTSRRSRSRSTASRRAACPRPTASLTSVASSRSRSSSPRAAPRPRASAPRRS